MSLQQIFVRSEDLQIPPRALTIQKFNPNFTISDLKFSIFPNNLPQKTLALVKDCLYFTLNGKPLSDSTLLRNSHIAPFSTLLLRFRLPGGGGDGGATGAESRDCYLNMYAVKKPDKVDPNEQRLAKWLNCSLSNEPLKHPVVIDKLGNLFNKEALVEALLKKRVPKEFGYIKGLKDMINLELEKSSGVGEDRFQCPISGLEFNGKYKFFALRTCGHVLSAKALKEVKSSSCLVCRKEFAEDDKIVINGNEEEVAVLRERMEAARVRVKDGKKGKKEKNGEEGVEVVRLSGKKHGIEENGKVGVNGKIEVKDVKNGAANVPVKKFKAVDIAPAFADKKIYASLFTSSKKKSDFKETYSCRSLPLGRN